MIMQSTALDNYVGVLWVSVFHQSRSGKAGLTYTAFDL